MIARSTNQELTVNPNRLSLDEAYINMAYVWARRSKANRKQVGALIVKGDQIISDGYNGMPAGEKDDVCEYWHQEPQGFSLTDIPPTLRTKPEVLHAESNAIAKLAKNGGEGCFGATVYITMSPCIECAKLMWQSGIKRVVFDELYRDDAGIQFLRLRGVPVDHFTCEAIK